MYIINLKIILYSVIGILIVVITYPFLKKEPIFQFLTLIPILFLPIVYTFFKNYQQKTKDDYFKKNFSDSQFIPISGIYENLDLDKVRVSLKKLEDSYWSVPYFLNFLVRLEDYKISKKIRNGIFKANVYHRKPMPYNYKFNAKEFKYSLISFDFQHNNTKDLKFSILIVKIENLSIPFFVSKKTLNRDFFKNYGVNLPSYYSSKIPLFFNSIFRHLGDLDVDNIGYNPFGFFNLNFFKNENLLDIENDFSSFLFFDDSIASHIDKNNWYSPNLPSFLLTRIIGERTFFDYIIEVFTHWQNNPFLNLGGWMPEQNLIEFIDFFQLYKNSIYDKLPPREFTALENYLDRGNKFLKMSSKLYDKFNLILDLDERVFFTFFNIKRGIDLVKNILLNCYRMIHNSQIKPTLKNNEKINIIKYISDIFAKPGRGRSDTIIFDKKGVTHDKLIEHIKIKIKDSLIKEVHNIRDEACGDLVLYNLERWWKIGIAVEVRYNLEKKNGSYIKNIHSKIMKSKGCDNLDLLVILFCVNNNSRSISEKLNIATSNLEQLEGNNTCFYYLTPENLVSFFEDIETELKS